MQLMNSSQLETRLFTKQCNLVEKRKRALWSSVENI